MNYAKNNPLVSSTKFSVPPSTVADETDYSGTVAAGNGGWVLGSTLKGRRIKVIVAAGAISGSPTGLRVGLYKGTDANGGSGAVVTGTTKEWTTVAANMKDNSHEIDLGTAVDDVTAYYSLGLALKGGGSTTLVVGATAEYLDAPIAS